MSAATDARHAERAANALRALVSAIRAGGDVALWSDNAAKCLRKYDGKEWPREALVGLGVVELVAFAERLDRYVEAVRG